MKNKFIRSIATLLLLATVLSNWALEIGSVLMPGASTCATGVKFEDDDYDEDDYIPYKK